MVLLPHSSRLQFDRHLNFSVNPIRDVSALEGRWATPPSGLGKLGELDPENGNGSGNPLLGGRKLL